MSLIELREKAKRLLQAIEQTKEVVRSERGVVLTDDEAAAITLEAIGRSKSFERWLGLTREQAQTLLEIGEEQSPQL